MLARFGMRVAFSGLVAVVLPSVGAGFAAAQGAQLIPADETARATLIDVPVGEPIALKGGQYGSVWVVLRPLEFIPIPANGDVTSSERAGAGDSGKIGSGEKLWLRAEGNVPGRLVVVEPSSPHQELTVGPLALDSEDASDRNDTLLVAITDCRFSDVWNLGDESKWKPSRPEIVAMKAGSVRWIRAGIHHFRNLGLPTAQVISIEW